MLILILIDVQYLQNVVFNAKKSLNCQGQYSSDSQHQIKNPIKQNFQFLYWEEFLLPLNIV